MPGPRRIGAIPELFAPDVSGQLSSDSSIVPQAEVDTQPTLPGEGENRSSEGQNGNGEKSSGASED
jgi:hypothetical protein